MKPPITVAFVFFIPSIMRLTFPKSERLTHKREIDQLFDPTFSENESHFKFPIKLIFQKKEALEVTTPKVLISVSKRRFKRAVDRNLIKRRMREAYRLNKEKFCDRGIDKIAIIFVGKEILPFTKIQSSVIRCSNGLSYTSEKTRK